MHMYIYVEQPIFCYELFLKKHKKQFLKDLDVPDERGLHE